MASNWAELCKNDMIGIPISNFHIQLIREATHESGEMGANPKSQAKGATSSFAMNTNEGMFWKIIDDGEKSTESHMNRCSQSYVE